MIIVGLIVVVAIMYLFLLAMCKAAARADEQMEKSFHEWLARQQKDKPNDATLADL